MSDERVAEAPSFIGAPRWAIDQDDVRLRMSDRLVSRLPAITRRIGDRVFAEPRGSRLRRWLLTRVVLAGWAALDEGDLEYVERLYAPDSELTVLIDLMDMTGTHTGWPAVERFLTNLRSVFGLQSEIREVIDLGGSFLAASTRQTLTGRESGIAVAENFIYMYEMKDGLCVRQWHIADEAEGERVLAQRLAAEERDPQPR